MSYNGPSPLMVASFAERLSRDKGDFGNLFFFAIVTMVSRLVAYNAWEQISKRHEAEQRGR